MKKSKKNIYYLTYSYYPSGVFKSQIFDVIKLLRKLSDQDVKLISFFSVRVYFKCRRWVKKDMPDAIVLPIIFGMKRWEKHAWLLNFVAKKTDYFIGRNPMGSKVALNYSPNVIYDGRSALKGEIKEYDMALNQKLNESFIRAEEHVVKNAKYRMAVSTSLVDFWKNDFGYNSQDHIVVPCSLAYSHNEIIQERPKNKNVTVVFSGGGSPWQSQKQKYDWIEGLLNAREDIEFVFLSKTDDHLENLIQNYPERVHRKWLKPEEVSGELAKADYGILVREDNLTNRVASPVKFAEYLSAGLKVIISPCVKDFSQFVEENKCGIILNSFNQKLDLAPLENEERLKNSRLAKEYFSKDSKHIQSKYQTVINMINR